MLIDKVIFVVSCCPGSKSGLDRAAFPNGLPKALEALVATQTSTEPSSSDSDHGGMQSLLPDISSAFPVMLIFH
jgi:hypothetical protein